MIPTPNHRLPGTQAARTRQPRSGFRHPETAGIQPQTKARLLTKTSAATKYHPLIRIRITMVAEPFARDLDRMQNAAIQTRAASIQARAASRIMIDNDAAPARAAR